MVLGISGQCRPHEGPLWRPPAAAFLELTKKKANELGRPICSATADQMEKGYVDDGNGGGSEEMVDRMIGEVTQVDGQLYFLGTVSLILDTLSL